MALPKSYGVARGWPAAAGLSARPELAPGGVAVCGAGLVFPNQPSGSAASNNRFQRAGIPFFAPPWAGTDWELLLPTYLVSGSGGESTTNLAPIGISYQTLFNAAGAPFSIKIAGADAATLPLGTNTWCQIPGFVNVPNEKLTWFGEYFVNVGEKYPVGYFPGLKGQGTLVTPSNDLGGGREGGGTSDPSKQFTGALGSVGASNGLTWGPAMARCKGWDGVTRVFVIWGDSRDYGTDDLDYAFAAKRASGAAARGLVDEASGVCAYANLSGPGAWALNNGLDGGMKLRWQALLSAPNLPFHDFIESLGGNDMNNGAQVPDLAAMQGSLGAMWANLKARAPNARIYHLFGIPWSADQNNKGFSTEADQLPPATALPPDGVQQQVNDWLRTGAGLPDKVIPIDLAPALESDVFPGHWKAPSPPITGSLVSVASRTHVVDFPGVIPFENGMCLSVGVDTANVENFQIVDVISVADNGAGAKRYTFNSAGGAVKTHAAGDACAIAWVHSTAHPGSYLARRGADVIAAAKRDGVIKTTV